MQLERGMSNKDVERNFNVAKNALSIWKKYREKIIAAIMSSGSTKEQRINKGTCDNVNIA